MPCPIHGGKHPFHDSRWITTADAVIEKEWDSNEWGLEEGSLICEMRDVPPGTAQRIVECVNAMAGVADPANAIAAAREALNYLIGYMDETEHATGVVMQCGIEHARAALALLEGVQP